MNTLLVVAVWGGMYRIFYTKRRYWRHSALAATVATAALVLASVLR